MSMSIIPDKAGVSSNNSTGTGEDLGSVFASPRPTFRRHNIPTALRAVPQWVRWKYHTPKDSRRPIKLAIGCLKDWEQRTAWNTPDNWSAFKSINRGSTYDGLGYVFTADDGFTGIDLDDVLTDGEFISPEVEWIVRGLDSYTEVSPSRTGLKIWVRAHKPAAALSKVSPLMLPGDIEIYDKNRWFAVTGDHLAGTSSTVNDSQDFVDELCRYYLTRDVPMATPQQHQPTRGVSPPSSSSSSSSAETPNLSDASEPEILRACLAALDLSVRTDCDKYSQWRWVACVAKRTGWDLGDEDMFRDDFLAWSATSPNAKYARIDNTPQWDGIDPSLVQSDLSDLQREAFLDALAASYFDFED